MSTHANIAALIADINNSTARAQQALDHVNIPTKPINDALVYGNTTPTPFARAIESSDHYDRMDGLEVMHEAVDKAERVSIQHLLTDKAPLTDQTRRRVNVALEIVEPGLRIGANTSVAVAANVMAQYYLPAHVAQLFA